jgi:hypothetical protein
MIEPIKAFWCNIAGEWEPFDCQLPLKSLYSRLRTWNHPNLPAAEGKADMSECACTALATGYRSTEQRQSGANGDHLNMRLALP